MKLLTALIIVSGDIYDLPERMKEAAETFQIEARVQAPMLCRETLRALERHALKKIKPRSKIKK